jgi:hypothetical protein
MAKNTYPPNPFANLGIMDAVFFKPSRTNVFPTTTAPAVAATAPALKASATPAAPAATSNALIG